MDTTVTRMAPGTGMDAPTHEGWAMTRHRADAGPAREVDLLFLHGMSAGAWVWPDRWMARFTGAGFDCWSMTLPGRRGGATAGSDPAALDRVIAQALAGGDLTAALDALARALPGASLLDGPTLDDFTDALEEALAEAGRPCVVVAHSLGGAVAQNLMRRGKAPEGTVLMCSVPPYGTWRASAEMALLNPDLWHTLAMFSVFGAAVVDPLILRNNFFPSGVRDADFARLLTNLRDESLAATAQALGFPPFAPFPAIRPEVLVIGGGRDRIIPPTDTLMTGFYHGGIAQFLPDAGHMMMYDDVDGAASDMILTWLDRFA
ncbi:MAG: alpha/beta hydrolase [Rhodobacteraceae bacterium]|nr:alpha/beta hydrolase [Paracoccaceae bacterium]